MLLLARPEPAARRVWMALDALATQLALALEGARLTEKIHLRRSEARFASLVQHSSDLITVVGSDATIAYQSPSSERVLGYQPDELLGTRFDRLVAGRTPTVSCGCSRTDRPTRGERARSSSARCATATAACGNSRSCTPTCSTTSTCVASS